MKRAATLIAAMLFFPASVLAQTQAAAVRSGFTVLANLGVGIQRDNGLESTGIGLAGANLGLGGFLTKDLALMFRLSGTTATHDDLFGSFPQTSGVAGATVQFWVNDRFTIEAGGGLGFWRAEEEDETGAGLILGATGVVFKRGGHILHVGVEYAPAFTEPGAVHNFGITFGYQFHRY